MRYFCRQRIGAKMDDDRGMNMGMDADNIEGIFNFCDAWCERCTFTNRCLNYKMRAEFEQEAIRR